MSVTETLQLTLPLRSLCRISHFLIVAKCDNLQNTHILLRKMGQRERSYCLYLVLSLVMNWNITQVRAEHSHVPSELLYKQASRSSLRLRSLPDNHFLTALSSAIGPFRLPALRILNDVSVISSSKLSAQLEDESISRTD